MFTFRRTRGPLRVGCLVALTVVGLSASIAPAGTIFDVSTVAGVPGVEGTDEGNGTGGKPPLALLKGPRGLVALNGKIYFVDGNRVRVFDPQANTVSTVVGNTSAALVDGNFAEARFFMINEIGVYEGDLYVTDTNTLRRIDLEAQTVLTIAGQAGAGSADGTGTAASFDSPRGPIAVGGKLYVADANNSTLRRIDPVTLEVTTVAGAADQSATVDGIGTSARFVSPRNLAGEGRYIYISDTNGAVIRRFDVQTSAVTTIVGNGTPETTDGIGTAAHVRRPRGLALYGGSLYFADFEDHVVRRMDLMTKEVTTVAGGIGQPSHVNGTGTAARFNNPWGLATVGDALFVADAANFVLRRMSLPKADTFVTLNVTRGPQKLIAKGKVTPAQVGGEVSVKLMRKSDGVFRKRTAQFIVLPSDGRYEAKFNRPNSGRCRIITKWPGDDDSHADQVAKTFNC